jgi:Ca2+-binding EF-hand superfamily protein
MGVAMATIASFFINVGSIDDALQDMKKPISKEEIDMLTEFGLADEDGEIDKSEFIILCMVRTGAASPGLVKLMELYFNELDDDKSGTLSIDEILRNRDSASSAADKLMHDVRKGLMKKASKLYKSSRQIVDTLAVKTTLKGYSENEGNTQYNSVAMNEISGSNPMKIIGRDENYV